MQGFDESLAFVTQVFRDKGPFDGVVGFSQGAGFAALLMVKMQRGELDSAIQFDFGCLFAGFPPRDPRMRALAKAQAITVPCLHVFGTTDQIISSTRSQAVG